MIAPDHLSRLDYAREQLRDAELTPSERAAAWSIISDAAQNAIIDIANDEQDRADEALDAQRIHGGQTLDEFMGRE